MATKIATPPNGRHLFIAEARMKPKCGDQCLGPFVPAPEFDTWMAEMAADAGLPNKALPQYHCQNCRTTRGYSDAELRRAAA